MRPADSLARLVHCVAPQTMKGKRQYVVEVQLSQGACRQVCRVQDDDAGAVALAIVPATAQHVGDGADAHSGSACTLALQLEAKALPTLSDMQL